MVIPAIRSDLKDITINDFQIGGILLFSNRTSPSFEYSFGMYYNQECFGPFFSPLLGLNWNINQKINLFGLFPQEIVLEYKLSERFYTGIQLNMYYNTFRLSENYGDYYVLEGDKLFGFIQTKTYLNFHITKEICIFAEIGITTFRSFVQYNSSDEIETTIPVYSIVKDKLFFSGGLAYRIRFNNNIL